ncbi:unnamed protein product, partial [Adineta steineri]
EAIDITCIPTINDNTNKAEQIYFEKIIQAVDQANRFTNIRNSRMRSTNHLIYSSISDNYRNVEYKHLVPATSDLIQLNDRWQRKIKEDKERIRNASICEPLEDDFIEKHDTVEKELIESVKDSLPSNFDNENTLLSSRSIIPVTKITVPNEVTRENIVIQFTLNKNQKAAFMIITGHLNGLDKLNEGDKQDQLIMCVPGCGGTGKSQLIRAITAYFTQTNRVHKLRKLAPTSVAAAEIEGTAAVNLTSKNIRQNTTSRNCTVVVRKKRMFDLYARFRHGHAGFPPPLLNNRTLRTQEKKLIQSIVETSDMRHTIESLYGFYGERSWLQHINSLHDDGLAPLTKFAQKVIYDHQNPKLSQCKYKKYLVIRHFEGAGIGAQTHFIGSALGRAIDYDRILIWDIKTKNQTTGWHYFDIGCGGKRHYDTLDCLYEPLSGCDYKNSNENRIYS